MQVLDEKFFKKYIATDDSDTGVFTAGLVKLLYRIF